MGPTLRDYLLVLGCGAFAALEVLLLVGGADPGPALAGLAFFGFGAAFLGQMLVAKRRMAANARVVGFVEATGGRIPEDRATQLGLGAAVTAVGAVGVWGGGPLGWLFVGCCALVAAFGAWVFVATALGRRANGWIAFEPDGLHVLTPEGERVARWSEIAATDLLEFQGNPGVRITTADGSTLWIWPTRFSLDAVLLARAIGTYASIPEARAALGRRAIAPP